jgi:hypothetical protein
MPLTANKSPVVNLNNIEINYIVIRIYPLFCAKLIQTNFIIGGIKSPKAIKLGIHALKTINK